MKNYIEFFFLYVFFIFSKIIGLKASSFCGGVLLSIYGIFSKKNIIGMRNLSIVFPGMSKKEKKIVLKKMWFHFGRVVGEYPHLNTININNKSILEIQNIENLLDPIKKGNCIFFSAHIGNWELSSHPLIQNNYKISFIYRPPNNKLVENLLQNIRRNYGVELIKKGPKGAKECIKVLKKKGNLGMLIDQKMNDGIAINFFKKNAMTATAIAKLALKFKCDLIPAYCIRKKGVSFKVKYLEPITYKKIKKLNSEKEILLFLNTYVESWIVNNPEQWIWIHNRWGS
ncbi:MAG: lysophospholipid acyltransferase family protein [Alphaproteobacteria bacterium]